MKKRCHCTVKRIQDRFIVFSVKPKIDDNHFFADLLVMYKSQTRICFRFNFQNEHNNFRYNLCKTHKSTKNWSSNFSLIEEIRDLSLSPTGCKKFLKALYVYSMYR